MVRRGCELSVEVFMNAACCLSFMKILQVSIFTGHLVVPQQSSLRWLVMFVISNRLHFTGQTLIVGFCS